MRRLGQTSRRLSYFILGITMMGLLLAPGARLSRSRFKLPGNVAHATVSKSYVDFITAAYEGAYGREPDCTTELEPEYYNMVYAASNSALLAECQRFVATLFETQASYDAQDLTTYTQTSDYEARNAHTNTSYGDQEAFVTDLYHAFLQRAPDSTGLAFWTDDVIDEGRKKGVVAFTVCGEFEDLVATLYAGSAPDCGTGGCGITCDSGYILNPETCICVADCLGANGGRPNPLCEQ
jgi:Domain of unknown function (DUF4214)